MKDLIKTLTIIAAIVSILASIITLLDQLGLLHRRYLTVEEN